MHAYTQCKAKHHPVLICSLCSPIKFFILFIDFISACLEVLVWFYVYRNHCVPEWSRNQQQGKYNQNQLRLSKLRMHAKREINSGSKGMDATLHDIDSTRQSVDLASSSNFDSQQMSLGSFVHGAQEDDGVNQERQTIFQSYESYRPMGKRELDSIGDPYVLLLAGLKERERVLRLEEEIMQNFCYLQETLAFNKTAASIQERDVRRRLTSSFPDMRLPSFPS